MNLKPESEAGSSEDIQPTVAGVVAATVLVAAVYTYFLIFAQFGFLQTLVLGSGRGPESLPVVLGAMAVAGVAASVLAARWLRPERRRQGLAGALVLAGVAAGLARGVDSTPGFVLAAMLVGGGLGAATVLLAALIRGTVGGRRLGTILGCGTGTAYGFCNLPIIFHATPAVQAGVALAAVAVGVAAVPGLAARPAPALTLKSDHRLPRAAMWIGMFLALVWLDSAAFYLIQHDATLQPIMWGDDGRLYANALWHLAAALVAGRLLDRGRLPAVMLVAAALLAAACLGLRDAPGLAASAYVAGVSLYSTALVYYPAASGRAGLAAAVYAISGWLGSTLGIGMVLQRAAIPPWFPIAALAAVAVALGARHWMNKD